MTPDARLFGSSVWREQTRESLARAVIEYRLRLHLIHAYAWFTSLVDEHELQSWKWLSWLRANKDRLNFAVSFNYDLLLEQALREIVSTRYLIQGGGLFGLNQEVLVFKPHGSINFEFTDKLVQWPDRSGLYAAGNAFSLMNASLRILPDGDLDQQRINADIVLPTEASGIRHFQYIEPGYRYLRSIRHDITRCIIVGISYWECDRPEIDEMLSSLRSDAQVLICNPYPPSEMLRRWSARFPRLEIIKAGVPGS